jgi:putative CocE/NonD family hydrolase
MNSAVSKPEYDIVIMKDVTITTRDGIELATDIYQPAKNGILDQKKYPAILQRTPYNKEDPNRIRDLAEWFCTRGYAVVLQDFRGRFKSEGSFYKYQSMGEDGFDTVEWIAQQRWSNGKIGTIGTSFMAHFQMALACLNPPHLTTMIVNQGGFSNAYFSSCRHMGAFELRQLTWAFSRAVDSKEASVNPLIRDALKSIDPVDYLDPKRGPLKQGQTPLALIPSYEQFYFDMLTKTEYTDYWKKPDLCAEQYYDHIPDIPILLIGSWYDSYTRSTSENYIGLASRKKGPIRLIFGPWTHGWQNLERTYAGEVDFGVNAKIQTVSQAPSANAVALRWFDHWLKNRNLGLKDDSPVKLFVMGGGTGTKNMYGRLNHGGRWRNEHEWPLNRATPTPYYFHGNGTLTTEPPNATVQPSTYSFDPRNPVPTIGGNISAADGVMMPGAYNQMDRSDVLGCNPPYLPLATRNDVIVFRTSPLKRDLEVTGPLTAQLWVATSAPDTDFTLKLIDLYPPSEDYPNGFAMNLSDTIFRARYNKSWTSPEPLQSNTIYKLNMISYPTSNLFKTGHQLRVDISSSNYPRFDANPNSGEPLGRGRMSIIAHQKIYHDAKHPTHILLPIVTNKSSPN